MTSTFWPRLLKKIDHPHRDQIPRLAYLDGCPPELDTPWIWTGALTKRTPVFWHAGKTQTVARLLHDRLIGPPSGRLRPLGSRLDVNPYHYSLPNPNPDLPDGFSMPDLIDWIDTINPATLTDLDPILEEIPPLQVFNALKTLNLLDRLGVRNSRDVSTPANPEPRKPRKPRALSDPLPRILAKVDHPHRDELHLFANRPFPERLNQHPWRWTGGRSKGVPYCNFNGRSTPVTRALYQLMIGPIPDHAQVLTLAPDDVNPALCVLRQNRQLETS